MNQIPRRPVLLVILDGVGVNPSKQDNAMVLANTPHLDHLFANHPHTLLQASGQACGLPDGQMGNSEVGHLTIGSGSIVRQNLVVIDDAIRDGSFFRNEVLLKALNRCIKKQTPIEVLGLISDGGVHSHINHLLALIEMSHSLGVKVNIHMITDGRDTAPQSALKYLEGVERHLEPNKGKIVSVMGRFFAMDRDNRWERIEQAWRCIVMAEGLHADSASEAIQQAYDRGETDEFIRPTRIANSEELSGNETWIFTNFRKDRPRQILSALTYPEFEHFDRNSRVFKNISCFTEYADYFHLPFAFEADRSLNNISEIISNMGIEQLHCAETEKYAHVTFFFNGGKSTPFPGEDRCLIDSPKVSTYDLAPQMSATAITDELIDRIKTKQYGFIVVNYANGDMVGHTANREAIIEGVECLDTEIGRLIPLAVEQGFSVILTADHGNCEEMIDPINKQPHTQHTAYPVPCLVVDPFPWRLSCDGGLKNVLATVLQLMGITKPDTVTTHSLLLG